LEVLPNQCLNESMANDDTRSSLRALLLEKSVRTGEFTLASGKTSDLYIDCRVTAMDPHGANLIGKLGWETVKQEIAARGLAPVNSPSPQEKPPTSTLTAASLPWIPTVPT